MKSRIVIPTAIVAAISLGGLGYTWYFADRIAPRTAIGSVQVGGLTKERAAARLQEAMERLETVGITLAIEDRTENLSTAAIGVDLNLADALDTAFRRGHAGSAFTRVGARIGALWGTARHPAPIRIDAAALAAQVARLADAHDRGRRDIRLGVQGTEAALLTDTEPGKLIDREDATRRIEASVRTLEPAVITLRFQEDPPRIDTASAPEAVADAQRMLARPLTLAYEDKQFTITRERIGGWIISEYDGDQLLAGLDRELIGEYVADIVAPAVNIEPKAPVVTTEGRRVISFTPPEVGKAVQVDELVGQIWDTLMSRAAGEQAATVLTIPVKAAKLALAGLDEDSGITELIGTATTNFKGSPKNRISNIKNGVKHLTGTLLEPGQEFSALALLSPIDETTGYLPELVIKGDRTIPEFGGGLCQVSTTLFRAAMDAGLPITARRNHSFRVGYYEKDGNGKYIGPGLDATIYEPNTDFRFMNDTAHQILVIGYVAGDRITFDFYGTSDGRTSTISGPKILTEIPAGDAVYIETLDLPVGTTKQVEQPHPGGSTMAGYAVIYPDGHTAYQEFVSWYRRWPPVFLKGVSVLSSPTPAPAAGTPFPVSPPLP